MNQVICTAIGAERSYTNISAQSYNTQMSANKSSLFQYTVLYPCYVNLVSVSSMPFSVTMFKYYQI